MKLYKPNLKVNIATVAIAFIAIQLFAPQAANVLAASSPNRNSAPTYHLLTALSPQILTGAHICMYTDSSACLIANGVGSQVTLGTGGALWVLEGPYGQDGGGENQYLIKEANNSHCLQVNYSDGSIDVQNCNSNIQAQLFGESGLGPYSYESEGYTQYVHLDEFMAAFCNTHKSLWALRPTNHCYNWNWYS